MRPHVRKALDADRVQPEPGEPYVACKHVEGSPKGGFVGVHVIRVLDSTLRVPERDAGLPRKGDVMGVTIPPAWFFLCDACWRKHESGEDGGEIVGTDGIWPEGAYVEYIRRARP